MSLDGAVLSHSAAEATARRIHPHVERTVVAKREAARRVVDLRRRDAEVEQDPVDRMPPVPRGFVVQRGEAAMDDGEATVVDRGGRRDGIGVAIEGQQPTLRRQAFEDASAVTAATERAVDEAPVAPRIVDREAVDGFVEQDRAMDERRDPTVVVPKTRRRRLQDHVGKEPR